MHKLISVFLVTAVLASSPFQLALADDWHGGRGDWHGDIHGFQGHDFDHWRGGNWFHGPHDGHDGWWWVVDGSWYFYPAPVYPYPDPYTPPTVAMVPSPGTTVVAEPAYYYCRNPAGYYPYVAQCYGPWQKVIGATAPATVVVQSAPPAQAMTAPAPVGGDRESDQAQLGAFTAAFENIDLTGKQANARLKDLNKQIDDFRQSLYTRSYNAMDILRDAESLQHRIAAQRAKLTGHKAVQSSAMPATPPASGSAPTSLPPGTAVTFPPQ